MNATYTFDGPKRAKPNGCGWSRAVLVDGKRYQCVLTQGRKVRIPYKPRGTYGFLYDGAVYDGDGRRVWTDRVAGSIGCRGLLKAAGVIA